MYLGSPSENPPGYVDRELLEYWFDKDPIPNHREYLIRNGCAEKLLIGIETEERQMVDDCRNEMESMPWPEGHSVGEGVTSPPDARSHSQKNRAIWMDSFQFLNHLFYGRERKLFFSLMPPELWTFSRAIQNAIVEIADFYGDDVVFMGEDMEIAGGLWNESTSQSKRA